MTQTRTHTWDVHVGGRTATAEGFIRTEDGESLLAHGTTACLVMRP